MAAQPPHAGDGQVHEVVSRVRDVALDRLRHNIGLAFGLDPGGLQADTLARFALAAIDGAFVAAQADPSVRLGVHVAQLPEAVVALHRALP